jgi:hypothetical protein
VHDHDDERPVKVPNAESALIAAEKLQQYLLNPAHRRGASKARLLIMMGYSATDWHQLEADLRVQHLTADIELETDTEYGVRYEVIAPLVGPNGRSIVFRSVWQIDRGTEFPRFITLYPD